MLYLRACGGDALPLQVLRGFAAGADGIAEGGVVWEAEIRVRAARGPVGEGLRKWLRWWFFGVKDEPQLVAELPRAGEPTEICEEEWRRLEESYRQGLAIGEYRGRIALAKEIEAEFALRAMTEEDARRIVQKQVH